MRISTDWLSQRGVGLPTEPVRLRHAQLSHYTATFREWGDGPPLVLIPGLAGGIELVSPLARILGRHFHVIAYELRGEEDYFALRRRCGLAGLIEDLDEFLEWHNLERPNLMGVSFGGLLALEFAARFPHRLRTLAVQGVGARFERNLVERVAATVLDVYPLPPDSAFFNQFFHLLFGRGPQPKPLIDFVSRCCWQTDQSVMTHRFRLVRRRDLTPRLSKVQCPTLVLSAERDLFVSTESLAALSNGLPDGRCVPLARGGHLAFVADPERIASEVVRFAGSVE